MTGVWSREAGASLLELLVAMALLALLSAYALGAIHHLRILKNIETRLSGQDVVDAAADHIRRSMESMRPGFAEADGLPPRLAFSGQRNAILFVAEADPRLEFGGLYEGRLSFEKSRVVVHRRVFRTGQRSSLAVTILENVSDVSIEYFGSPDTGFPPAWHRRWERPQHLPLAIRISVDFPPGDDRRWKGMMVNVPAAR